MPKRYPEEFVAGCSTFHCATDARYSDVYPRVAALRRSARETPERCSNAISNTCGGVIRGSCHRELFSEETLYKTRLLLQELRNCSA